MEQRQGRLLAQQEGWLQERRQATGTLPERTQELLQIEVRPAAVQRVAPAPCWRLRVCLAVL